MNTNVFKADHFEPLLISPSWMSTITHLSLFAAHRLSSAVLFFWKTCLCQKQKNSQFLAQSCPYFWTKSGFFFCVWHEKSLFMHLLFVSMNCWCSGRAHSVFRQCRVFFFHAALMSEILKIASCSRANRLIYTCLRWCRVSF